LGILQRNDIDVVVININDLGVEGVQILDSMKQKQPPTEFITLTSPSTMLLSIEGMKREAFADLLIPFDMEDLIVKIRDAGARSRQPFPPCTPDSGGAQNHKLAKDPGRYLL
jgi:DNA-binding NtrC family response regulator